MRKADFAARARRTIRLAAVMMVTFVGLWASPAIAVGTNDAASFAMIARAIDADRLKLGTFARDRGFDGLRGAPQRALDAKVRVKDETNIAPSEAIETLAAHDAKAAIAIIGAQDRASLSLLSADGGGAMDLAAIDAVVVGEPTPEWQCLSEALYFEARGESIIGQLAVAEVILNRVDSPRFPDSVCNVVEQGEHNGHPGCQFSYRCDGLSDVPASRHAFDRVGKVAWVMLKGKPRILTGKATFYHTIAVSPSWSRKFTRTARIGDHLFYRRPVRLTQR